MTFKVGQGKISSRQGKRGGKVLRDLYEQIAEARGVSIRTVRNAVSAKEFDPGDVKSIVGYICRKNKACLFT